MGSFLTASAQLNETFDGAWPPTGWTVESTNTSFTWANETAAPINGTGSASVAYDPAPADQDESLISPEFTLPVGTPSLSFTTSLSYFWAVVPNNNYDFIISITNDGGVTWTAIWDETDLGVFTSFTPLAVTVPLADYAGDDVQIKFQYVGNDGAQLVIDDINIITCAVPTAFNYVGNPTTTSVSLTWTAPAGSPEGYEFEYGIAGFTQGEGTLIDDLTTNQIDLTDLDSGTTYAFYIRTECSEGEFSDWVGPITFQTSFEAASIPYSYGFEEANGWASQTWSILTNTQAGQDVSYEGEAFALSNTDDVAASDAWLFSRPINVEAGQTIDITFFTSYLGGGVDANLDLTVGTTDEDQTVIESFSLAPVTGTTIEYSENTASWTATEAGVYVFGFHQNTPGVGTDNGASLLLDSIDFAEGTASTEDFATAAFSVFPNPSNSIVNVANAGNIDAINVVDINGRTVKSAKFNGATEAQVNISDLANGVYLMTIASDKGTATKKIVKN